MGKYWLQFTILAWMVIIAAVVLNPMHEKNVRCDGGDCECESCQCKKCFQKTEARND